MKLKTSKGDIELPDNPTPQQQKAIALALIRTTFEDDATNIGEIEPLPPDGWKTTYEANGTQFEIEYTPKGGFGKMPISPAGAK
jgi:hypothetical protein